MSNKFMLQQLYVQEPQVHNEYKAGGIMIGLIWWTEKFIYFLGIEP
jgi:hypothetical protein